MNSEILKRAKKIKLLAMDIDGVLTGGEIIILPSGEEVKIWSVKDRMGFALVKNSKPLLKLAWITARKSREVKIRAKELGIDFLYQGCHHKWTALSECAAKQNIKPEEIAYIGDDLIDLPALKKVGFAACPPESPDILKKYCHYQTITSSGKGVFREVAEIILQAQGSWESLMKRFVLLFVLLSFSALGCSPKVPTQTVDLPDQWLESFIITETSDGIPVWVLNSEKAQIYNKKNKATLDNISIQFMDLPPALKQHPPKSLQAAKKALTQVARLTAPSGEVTLEEHDLSAWGGVVVQAEDGTTLYTERLVFRTKIQKITTESPIKIVKRDSILIGEGLEATPDLSTVKILRHQASIYPKSVTQTEKELNK